MGGRVREEGLAGHLARNEVQVTRLWNLDSVLPRTGTPQLGTIAKRYTKLLTRKKRGITCA